MNQGFTLVEFIVSLFILGVCITIGFTVFDFQIETIASMAKDLEIQGNIRFAATFIDKLLTNSQLSDVTIWNDTGDSSKLVVKNTRIRLDKQTLMVNYQYPHQSKENKLVSYVTRFEVTNDDGLISVKLAGGDNRDDEVISIEIKRYLGE